MSASACMNYQEEMRHTCQTDRLTFFHASPGVLLFLLHSSSSLYCRCKDNNSVCYPFHLYHDCERKHIDRAQQQTRSPGHSNPGRAHSCTIHTFLVQPVLPSNTISSQPPSLQQSSICFTRWSTCRQVPQLAEPRPIALNVSPCRLGSALTFSRSVPSPKRSPTLMLGFSR